MNTGVQRTETREVYDPEKYVKHDSKIKDKLSEFVRMIDPAKAIDFPVRHLFVKGLYVREIVNPAGSWLLTKIHKTQHVFTVIEGEISVVTDSGLVRIKAPYIGVTEPGTQRAIYAHSHTKFVTYHPNPDNETDINVLEERLIAKPHETIDASDHRIDITQFMTGDTTLWVEELQ